MPLMWCQLTRQWEVQGFTAPPTRKYERHVLYLPLFDWGCSHCSAALAAAITSEPKDRPIAPAAAKPWPFACLRSKPTPLSKVMPFPLGPDSGPGLVGSWKWVKRRKLGSGCD